MTDQPDFRHNYKPYEDYPKPDKTKYVSIKELEQKINAAILVFDRWMAKNKREPLNDLYHGIHYKMEDFMEWVKNG